MSKSPAKKAPARSKAAAKAAPRKPAAKLPPSTKRATPPVAPVGALAFPAIERARLSNGIPVALARRTAVPKLIVSLSFDAGYADKLFRPFQRLHSQDEFPGHGIGLASVKRIIERHGGQIGATGSTGNGATFWFRLGEPVEQTSGEP